MTYNSIPFIIFFAVYLLIYLVMPKVVLRQAVILIGSIIFYKYACGWNLLVVILATSFVVYFISRCIEHVYAGFEKEKEGLKPKEQALLFAKFKKKSKKYLLLAMVLVIGILVYVKVGGLFQWKRVFTVSQIFQWKTYLVPLGISYYTFSSVGYLLDVYWKKTKCEHNYLKLLTCMIYFPHIVQGPISRYPKLLHQFNELPGFSYERVCFGIQRMLWGYFKKMVVADRISLFTSAVYYTPSDFAGIEIVIAVVLGAIELYADFSGCMDIVIGASETMGIVLDENFKQPFFSRSAAEFWRRWHITLGTWFKDYVYMPVAMSPGFMKFAVKIRKKFGNRAGQVISAAVPLMIVWFLTGLWHGTGSDYIVWGLYWGILIILGTVLAPDLKKLNNWLKIDTSTFGFRLFQMSRTFCIFCIGRMLTVTGSLEGFAVMVQQIFKEHRLWSLFDGGLYNHGLDQKNFYIVLFGILIMWGVDMLQNKGRIRENLSKQPVLLRWGVYYGAIVLVLIFGMYGSAYDASSFIYGGF